MDGKRFNALEMWYGTGDPDTVHLTKEQREQMQAMFGSLRPKWDASLYKGTVLIMGTGGELDNSSSLKELFFGVHSEDSNIQ